MAKAQRARSDDVKMVLAFEIWAFHGISVLGMSLEEKHLTIVLITINEPLMSLLYDY